MLSLFPQILFLAPFSALLIRLALAILLALAAWHHFARRDNLARSWSIVEIALAVALFVGAWTQGAALLGFVITIVAFVFPRVRSYPRSTMLVMLVLFLSLLVTGAGAFAFDWPL